MNLLGTFERCLSGHYYAVVRGDEECPVCDQIKQLREERINFALEMSKELLRIVKERDEAQAEVSALREDRERLVATAGELVDAMNTCHQCGGTVLVEDGPIHCEDCSSDCSHHQAPDCPSIADLHATLKRFI
jgi:hypothetical protein